MRWFSSAWREVLDVISRAGGGGSSSAGGGGSSSGGGSYSSSSGGSGGGDINTMLIVIAFIIAGVVSSNIFEKVKKNRTERSARMISGLSGVAVTVIYVGILQALLPDGEGKAFASIGSFLSGAIVSFFATKSEAKSYKKQLAKEAALEKAASLDGVWDEDKIIERARQVFFKYQSDWASKNIESIQTYTTPQYFNHAKLMLRAIQQMGRHSDLSGIVIHRTSIFKFHDDKDNQKDRVSVEIRAQMRARLVETTTNKILQEDSNSFIEWWNFVRQGDEWMLDGIDQFTADPSKLVVDLQNFAKSNNMHFSPDWGHQLIPTRGQMFKSGFYGTDINNHVIGLWGDLIVQLYTYSPDISKKSPTYYIVGQINLPKSYGGIMVLRRKPGLFNRLRIPPRSYAKYELEWGEFNQRYDVLATDMDKVTSFELLNPAFMAWLYDRNIKVDIEVVDNVVYLYAQIAAGENRYSEMLEILSKSHAELKM